MANYPVGATQQKVLNALNIEQANRPDPGRTVDEVTDQDTTSKHDPLEDTGN